MQPTVLRCARVAVLIYSLQRRRRRRRRWRRPRPRENSLETRSPGVRVRGYMCARV